MDIIYCACVMLVLHRGQKNGPYLADDIFEYIYNREKCLINNRVRAESEDTRQSPVD